MNEADICLIERLKKSGQWSIVRLATAVLRTCSNINIYGEIMVEAYQDDEKVVKQELLIAIRKDDSFANQAFLLRTLDELEDKTFACQFRIKKCDDNLVSNIMMSIKDTKLTRNRNQKVIKKERIRHEVYENIERLSEIARRGEHSTSLKYAADYLSVPELNKAVINRNYRNMVAWAKAIIEG